MRSEPTPPEAVEDDPTLGPNGTDAVDLDPEGCAYTWTPEAPGEGWEMQEVRCTRPIHDGDDHRWDSREAEERTERVRAVILEAMQQERRHLTRAVIARVDERVAHLVNDEKIQKLKDALTAEHLPAALEAAATAPDPKRCDIIWKVDAFGGVQTMRCTHRGDVAHEHYWSRYEDELWLAHDDRVAAQQAGA